MELVTCYCLKCKGELARFRNAWNGIGNSYFTPAYPALSIQGLVDKGQVYQAASGSQIEDSLLRDVACYKCRRVLGLRCDSAPEGHLLQKDQLILRLAQMTIISDLGGPAKISVLKTFALRGANSNILNPRGEFIAQPLGRALLPKAQIPNSFTQDVTGRQSLHPNDTYKPLNDSTLAVHPNTTQPSFTTNMSQPQSVIHRRMSLNDTESLNRDSQAELEIFKVWAKEAISSQKKDIDRISGTVERIEGGMQSFKDFIQEVREELASNRQVQESKHDEDQMALRKDLDQLSLQIKNNEHNWNRQAHQSIPAIDLLNEKFETIAGNVLRINNKAKEVDDIKRMLEQLKKRIDQVEDVTYRSTIRSSPSTKRKYDEREIQTPSIEQSPELPPKRKRVDRNFLDVVMLEENPRHDNLEAPKSPEHQFIDLISSDAPSPILGNDDHIVPKCEESMHSPIRRKMSPQVVVYVPTSKLPNGVRDQTNSIRPGISSAPSSEPKKISERPYRRGS